MTSRSLLLAGAAAITLIGCGNAQSNAETGKASVASISAAAKASSGSPFDKAFKLKSAAATDVDALIASLGYTGPKLYESSSFDSKLGATILNNLSFTGPDGNILTIAKAELYGVDEEAIARVKDGTPAIDAPFETVLQKVRLYDINLDVKESGTTLTTDDDGNEIELSDASEEVTMTVGGLEIDMLKLRQGGIDEERGEATMVAQVFNAFDLGGLYFKNVDVSVAGGDVGKLAFKAPDLRFVGFGGGKLAAMVANDLEYEIVQSKEVIEEALASAGPQAGAILDGPLGNILGLNGQRVKAKTMTWRNIDASSLVKYGLDGELPPTSERDVLSLGTGEITDYEQFIAGKRLLVAKSSTFEMDKFTWLIPNVIKSDIKDAVYDMTAYVPEGQDEIMTALTSRGLDKVKGDGFFTWNWDDKAGGANFSYGGTTDKLMDFSLTMDAGNLKFEEISSLIETENAAGFANIGNFSKFNMTLTDKNLLDAVFDIAALQMGAGTGGDLRQSAPAMVRLGGAQVTAINPIFEDYIAAFADFIGEGGTLEIAANPDEPLPFLQLGAVSQTAPQTLPDVMNLTVKHKK